MNNKNLIPFYLRSEEEARAIRSKGGKARAEQRRQEKKINDFINLLFDIEKEKSKKQKEDMEKIKQIQIKNCINKKDYYTFLDTLKTFYKLELQHRQKELKEHIKKILDFCDKYFFVFTLEGNNIKYIQATDKEQYNQYINNIFNSPFEINFLDIYPMTENERLKNILEKIKRKETKKNDN